MSEIRTDKEFNELKEGRKITDIQQLRGTHIKIKRGDYLLLCSLAALRDRDKVFEIDGRAERIVEEGG